MGFVRGAVWQQIGFARVIVGAALAAVAAGAQTADQGWLRYRHLDSVPNIPTNVKALGNSAIEQSAAQELVRGLQGMVGNGEERHPPSKGAILLGTAAEFQKRFGSSQTPWGSRVQAQRLLIHDDFRAEIPIYDRIPIYASTRLLPGRDRFAVYRDSRVGHGDLFIEARDDVGVLYGVFALLRVLASGQGLPPDGIVSQPAMAIRWVDQWDNPDGSITRGYGGRSIFFEGGNVRADLSQVTEYARLLASVGIDTCNLNSVNAAPELIDADHLKQIARIADAMRPWGVRVALSVALASPEKLGGLKTSDPLDPAVKAWWAAKADEIYKLIPDFAGFTVKADSEGEVGPASYGRSPADAANLLAGALEKHGGVVLYRAFVYNNHLDWKDPKADRARAAYDIFHPLDRKFLSNVIVQTKEGPIDFQAREPVSPLFAGLSKTNQAMELQVTQEYLGQQKHLVYIAPMWKQVLDFDLRADGRATPVKEVVAGKSFNRPLGGMVGVTCVGRDWLGSPMAMANLYAFGRLAWNPELTPEEIAREWIGQTLGNDPVVVKTVETMLMQSWPAYEHYTGFLGSQTLTDITGSHYGPNIEASERNGWGQWHFDDAKGIGMDRTVATGTGYVGQYPAEVARVYESLNTTPDNLLLFFHHVPYTYKLKSGESVIQYVYDSHYKGAEEAAELGKEWATLKGRVDPALFEDVRARLEYQAGHAIVWRDAIVQYFFKQSGIADAKGRAGHYAGRLEAEDARLTGYSVVDVTPWEDASGGKAVTCADTKGCAAEWTWNGAAGKFDVAVEYFDLQGGLAKFALLVNGKDVGAWTADGMYPSKKLHGDNSVRHTARGVELKAGDVVRVEGVPDGKDGAALDYVEVAAASD